MAFLISNNCIACAACVRGCDSDAIIYDGVHNKYLIVPDQCISCGCCYGACSVGAITADEKSRAQNNSLGGL